MINKFKDEIKSFTTDNEDEEQKEQFEEANQMVFITETIYEQVKLFLDLFITTDNERIRCGTEVFDPYRKDSKRNCLTGERLLTRPLSI